MSRIAVIGAGFAGLSAASYLAVEGHEVEVFEKHAKPGGRARQFTTSQGYTFDMGPSWYWMPDVFERYFADFGTSPDEHYRLHLLDPAFHVVYGGGNILSVPDEYDRLKSLFDRIEPGGGARLDKFMRGAQFKYETAMRRLIYSPGLSVTEFMRADVLRGAWSLQLFTSLSRHLRKYFRDPRLLTLMEFPVLFLGGTANNIPALYSLMNYAGLKLGTWYPQGGFGKVVSSMETIAGNCGVAFHYDCPVERITTSKGRAEGVVVDRTVHRFDAVIGAADYHHVEQLLPAEWRNYPESYWENRTMAPSCLVYYLGVRKRIRRLTHHTLFFDGNMEEHIRNIYRDPKWPENPQFYVGCPSKTDPTVAPADHENLFLLMPLAPGLADSDVMREQYFRMMIRRLELHAGEPIEPFIDFKASFGINDFISQYNAYRGNAYGLANTVRQTAIGKPRVRNRKLSNLFYAGQLTVPGPGVPAALVSGKIAAGLAIRYLISTKYEAAL
ncbi:MAG TPA: phytoene desaturase family protein [Puia sp.]|nr:phytoene desaturase family protein [Puia sp.]